jgi:hypothetical protein
VNNITASYRVECLPLIHYVPKLSFMKPLIKVHKIQTESIHIWCQLSCSIVFVHICSRNLHFVHWMAVECNSVIIGNKGGTKLECKLIIRVWHKSVSTTTLILRIHICKMWDTFCINIWWNLTFQSDGTFGPSTAWRC